MEKTVIFTVLGYTLQEKPLYDVITKHKDYSAKNRVGVKADQLFDAMKDITADLNNNNGVAVLFEID